MEITWYGHSSFLITTAKGIKIITDPYEPGAFGGELLYDPISDEADIVTVSHNHADHNYVRGLPGKPQVIRGAGRYEIKGIVVEGFSAFHDALQGAQRGVNIIFTFLADDIRVCHLGDLGHILSDTDIKNIGQIDVLMVPVGGAFTIGANEASTVVDQLRPKLIFPMHVKTAKCDIPLEPVDSFLQGKKDVQRLNKSSFTFTQEELKAGFDIVVLQPAL